MNFFFDIGRYFRFGKKSNMKLYNFFCDRLIFLLLGALLPFVFAPTNIFFLAPILLAAVFYFSCNLDIKRLVINWFLFGFGFFAVGISWVYISIYRFGGSNFFVASFLTILLVVLYAAFFALQAYISFKCYAHNNFIKQVLVLPAVWVLFEWIRGWFFTGFPWLFLSYSQTGSFLKGYAPIIGVYGVSFLVAMSAGLICAFFLYKKSIKIISIILLVLIWAFGFCLTKVSWTYARGNQLTIAVIQGNVDQKIKWSTDEITNILDTYQNLTQKYFDKNLIVWPEAAVTLPIPYSNDYLQQIATKAKMHNSSLIVGVPVETKGGDFYNAAIGLGNAQGVYYKRHLLPFGDYVPFANLLRGIINFFNLPMSEFKFGNKNQALIQVNHMPIATYICYEVAFASLVRSDLPKAELLLTLSDDSWFGDSLALWQHLQIGQMRALETGRYMIFSTNGGITAIIAPNGNIVKIAPKLTQTVLSGTVQAMVGATPWVRIGTMPVIIFIFLLLIGCIISRVRA